MYTYIEHCLTRWRAENICVLPLNDVVDGEQKIQPTIDRIRLLRGAGWNVVDGDMHSRAIAVLKNPFKQQSETKQHQWPYHCARLSS